MNEKVEELLIAHGYVKRQYLNGYKQTITGKVRTIVTYVAPKQLQYYVRTNGETKWQTIVTQPYNGYDEFIDLYLAMQWEVKRL